MLQSRLKTYKAARKRLIAGDYNCISFKPFLPDMSKIIPGIIRGSYWCITSYSNVGKTPLAKFMFVLIPYYFKLLYKPNLNLKVLYFALEEGKESFYDSMICARYNEISGDTVDIHTINGYNDKPVREEALTVIESEEFTKWFEGFDDCVTVISYMSRVSDIVAYIDKFAESRGTVTEDRYQANDPNEYVEIVIDHINMLDKANSTLRDQMSEWSKYAVQTACKKYNYVVCNVHQQAAEGENAQYNKFNKNEAALTNLGDNKALQRDYHIILGMNMPQRYESGIKEHNGYDLTKLGDPGMYRYVKALKNRFGPNFGKGLAFDYYTLKFDELTKTKKNAAH